MLEDQLSTSQKRLETVIELENELMRYKQQIDEMAVVSNLPSVDYYYILNYMEGGGRKVNLIMGGGGRPMRWQWSATFPLMAITF